MPEPSFKFLEVEAPLVVAEELFVLALEEELLEGFETIEVGAGGGGLGLLAAGVLVDFFSLFFLDLRTTTTSSSEEDSAKTEQMEMHSN